MPDRFLQAILRLPPRFTREEVWAAVPGLHEKTVNVYLSNLTSEGVIARVAPNTFERLEAAHPVELRPQLHPPVAALQGDLLPGLLQRIVLWGDADLAPFTHDAIMVPFVVVECPPQAADTVRSVLAPKFTVQQVRWRARLAEAIWSADAGALDRTTVFLATSSDLLGTWPAEGGVRVPRLERLFVDVLRFSALVPEAGFRMLETPDFDVQLALRIAGARGETGHVASFLTWAAMLHPDRAFARRVRNTFVHMNLDPGRKGMR